MKKLLTVMVGACLAGSIVGTASAGRPTTVFEDPAGDAGIEGGTAVGENSIPGFDQAGFDLVSGRIARAGRNLEFTVTSAAMPATGSLPEGATFFWNFMSNGTRYRFTIKSQDVGKPDALTQEGTDRVGRVDLEGHFRLETCEEGSEIAGFGWSHCKLVAFEDGSFDPASKSFSVTIPLGDIGASTGSLISPSASGSTRCQPCWIMHTAERTSPPGFILDGTDWPISYKVPAK
ncbi:MAG TPA: hypothetical protein VEV43_05490 [Actinomycetota bacterium]|nr:hypothetical protein [Actinomycetota bacterium]